MNITIKTMRGLFALVVCAAAIPAFAGGPSEADCAKPGRTAAAVQDAVRESQVTVADFERKDPSLARFFSRAEGYAVFPSVGKAAVGVGGAYGTGVLFEHGKATGQATLTQVTIGAQLGGQAYSEVIFFQTPQALAEFKKGWVMSAAQVSAVAVSAGTSATARYERGVALFTLTRGGLMAEASVGGQKFGFQQFAKL